MRGAGKGVSVRVRALCRRRRRRRCRRCCLPRHTTRTHAPKNNNSNALPDHAVALAQAEREVAHRERALQLARVDKARFVSVDGGKPLRCVCRVVGCVCVVRVGNVRGCMRACVCAMRRARERRRRRAAAAAASSGGAVCEAAGSRVRRRRRWRAAPKLAGASGRRPREQTVYLPRLCARSSTARRQETRHRKHNIGGFCLSRSPQRPLAHAGEACICCCNCPKFVCPSSLFCIQHTHLPNVRHVLMSTSSGVCVCCRSKRLENSRQERDIRAVDRSTKCVLRRDRVYFSRGGLKKRGGQV